MRLTRRLRHKFGISAPRMVVRIHVAWYWRWLLIGIFFILGFMAVRWTYEAGMRFAGFERSVTRHELSNLRAGVVRLKKENRVLRIASITDARQMQIDKVAQRDLAKVVKGLQAENSRAKEDLAFFQSLMSTDGKAGVVDIYHFRVEHTVLPGEYHYRLLLFQGGKRDRAFKGHAQLVINLEVDGKKKVMMIPARHSSGNVILLNFKYYQRVEGTFHIAPTMKLTSVQVRVYEKGVRQPRFIRNASLL